MQKLFDTLDAVRTGGAPVCGAAADVPHIRAVRMVQTNPITPVRPELIEPTELDGDRFWFVKDLEETLAACARAHALPGEMGVRAGVKRAKDGNLNKHI